MEYHLCFAPCRRLSCPRVWPVQPLWHPLPAETTLYVLIHTPNPAMIVVATASSRKLLLDSCTRFLFFFLFYLVCHHQLDPVIFLTTLVGESKGNGPRDYCFATMARDFRGFRRLELVNCEVLEWGREIYRFKDGAGWIATRFVIVQILLYRKIK